MTIHKNSDHHTHQMHGSQFHSYVAPSRGSRQLCAWRTEVAPGTSGAPHRVSHEEVFLVLEGSPTVTVDDRRTDLSPGDVVFVPESATVHLDNRSDAVATLWVTTSVGLTATTPGGATITPPWTR